MISIVIPTLNEAGQLPLTLEKIRANSAVHEIIVADGGSDDATLQIAGAAGAKVVCSPERRRSSQLNLGANRALGEILLFLHADTRLQNFSLAQIEIALKNERVVGGGFARRFDSSSMFLQFTCALATWRSICFGWFLGDQGIFVRRKSFDQLQGFRTMNIFEDVDFSRRMSRLGKVRTLRPGVISSARRFQAHGAVGRTCRDLWLTCRYAAGK
ncbi:MAG: TIGR04283 family arsenosugar biosynthesis glycosyltransferase [Verrucomicrobiota bacterium]